MHKLCAQETGLNICAMSRKWSGKIVVACYTLEGQLVRTYQSAKHASKSMYQGYKKHKCPLNMGIYAVH